MTEQTISAAVLLPASAYVSLCAFTGTYPRWAEQSWRHIHGFVATYVFRR